MKINDYWEEFKMTNTEKAKELYLACDNTDPNVGTLMPFFYKGFEKNSSRTIYYCTLIGSMINMYATEDFEDDLIPLIRENFYVSKQDNEGWKNIKAAVYRLEKKGLIESVFMDNQTFIRLTTDDFYDYEMYKRKEA